MQKKNNFLFILMLLLSLNACQTRPIELPHEQEMHFLSNKIWSVVEQKFISIEALQSTIKNKNIILLGETHDNIKHHELQAQLVLYLSANQPAIAFEMLNQNQQGIIDDFLVQIYDNKNNSAKKTDLFAKKINWQKSNWPEWSYYQPIFYNTITHKLPIIAMNMEHKQIRKVIKYGSSALPQKYQDLLVQYQYDDNLKNELEQEIQSAHCDMLPQKMLSPMLLGQQVRDLAMMQAIQKTLLSKKPAKKAKQIVVIAGSGHTRIDYGIPFYLQQENPQFSSASIAFAEVSAEKFKPQDYISAWSISAWNNSAKQLPFDYVWFTARAEREDQCEKMRAYMKKRDEEKKKSNKQDKIDRQ